MKFPLELLGPDGNLIPHRAIPMSDQFDFLSGKWEAEKGMALADGAARVQRWKERAEVWLHGKAKGSDITADDLVRDIGVPNGTQNNVVGAWFAAKSKEHKIHFTGRMAKSERVSRHTGLIRVWIVLP